MVCLINRGRFPMIKAIINVSPSPGCIVLVNVEVVLVVVLVVVLLIIAPIEASVPTWTSCLSDSSGGPADSEEGWVWKRGQRSFSHRIRVGSSVVSTGLRGLRGVSWCSGGKVIILRCCFCFCSIGPRLQLSHWLLQETFQEDGSQRSGPGQSVSFVRFRVR